MTTADKCPTCGADYTHGSALYDYYECGHAYEKPLNGEGKGKMVVYKSPYEPYKSRPLKHGSGEKQSEVKVDVWEKEYNFSCSDYLNVEGRCLNCKMFNEVEICVYKIIPRNVSNTFKSVHKVNVRIERTLEVK
jgi:hypothetical protein